MRDLLPKDVRRIEVLIQRLIETGSDGGAADARTLRVLLANTMAPQTIAKVRRCLERDEVRTEGQPTQLVNRLVNHLNETRNRTISAKRVIGYLMCDDDLDTVDHRSEDVNENQPTTNCIYCGPTRRPRRSYEGPDEA